MFERQARYCKRKLRKIYPDAPESLIDIGAYSILISIASAELDEIIKKTKIKDSAKSRETKE